MNVNIINQIEVTYISISVITQTLTHTHTYHIYSEKPK